MNRLYHLRDTLPKNINDNIQYSELQHVLLDYSSEDGLESWLRDELGHHLNSGRLVYYRFSGAKHFAMAHSKNMVCRLAQGEIVCLVDADNYSGENYAKFVNNRFADTPQSFITTIARNGGKNPIDVLGRVCFKKEDFMAVSGFDEFMNNYGHDDFDFCNRLEILGRKRLHLRAKRFLLAISHSNEERVNAVRLRSEIDSFYISHLSPWSTEIVCLFKGGLCLKGTLIDNRYVRSERKSTALESITVKEFSLDNGWAEGKWEDTGNGFREGKIHEVKISFSQDQLQLWIGSRPFRVIEDPDIYNFLVYITSVLSNYQRRVENWRLKTLRPNVHSFGAGTVYRNFDRSRPINL